MTPSSPIIVAHRGLHTRAPENSLGAFAAAAEAAIPWVECDVWPSADGVPVVIHDETLDRTTDGDGKVADHTWLQLQALQVPSLAQVLEVLGGKTGILVEIKPPDAIALIDRVRQALSKHAGSWNIQSFHPSNVPAASDWALLVHVKETLATALDGHWKNVHAQHLLIDRETVERLHAAGRQIGAWTVNHPADIRRMIDLGIDLLITDEPELAMKMVAERASL